MSFEKQKRVLCGLLASGGFLSSYARAENITPPPQNMKKVTWRAFKKSSSADSAPPTNVAGRSPSVARPIGEPGIAPTGARLSVGCVSVRSLRDDDIPMLAELFTKNIYRNMSVKGREMAELSNDEKLSVMVPPRQVGRWNVFPYVIEESTSRLPVGMITAYFDSEKKLAKLAYWVGTPYQNKGYASSCVSALAVKLARLPNVGCIGMRIFEDNNVSQKVKDKIFDAVKKSTGSISLSEYVIRENNGVISNYYLKKCIFDENSWNKIYQNGYLLIGENASHVIDQAEMLLANGRQMGLSDEDQNRLSQQITILQNVVDKSSNKTEISYIVVEEATGFPLGNIILSFGQNSDADLFCMTEGTEMSKASLALAKNVILGSKIKNVKMHCKSDDLNGYVEELRHSLSNDLDRKMLSLTIKSEQEKSIPVLSRNVVQKVESVSDNGVVSDKKGNIDESKNLENVKSENGIKPEEASQSSPTEESSKTMEENNK